MSEWLHHDDYADVWQCYAHIPVQQLTAAEVMAMVTPGSGETWTEELKGLWLYDFHSTQLLMTYVADQGVREPIIIGPDGRLWDGHHRLACALALNVTVPARVVPAEAMVSSS